VLRLAHDNPTWGYTRIRGANNLGHDIGRNTIKRILLEAGVDPAPERSKRTSWSAFLRAHWGAIAAMDFFTSRPSRGLAWFAFMCCSSSIWRADAWRLPACTPTS
jgi:hypothetical protein